MRHPLLVGLHVGAGEVLADHVVRERRRREQLAQVLHRRQQRVAVDLVGQVIRLDLGLGRGIGGLSAFTWPVLSGRSCAAPSVMPGTVSSSVVP